MADTDLYRTMYRIVASNVSPTGQITRVVKGLGTPQERNDHLELMYETALLKKPNEHGVTALDTKIIRRACSLGGTVLRIDWPNGTEFYWGDAPPITRGPIRRCSKELHDAHWIRNH